MMLRREAWNWCASTEVSLYYIKIFLRWSVMRLNLASQYTSRRTESCSRNELTNCSARGYAS